MTIVSELDEMALELNRLRNAFFDSIGLPGHDSTANDLREFLWDNKTGICAMLAKAREDRSTKVGELKERIIKMIDQGYYRFGWTTGPTWTSLGIEEKAAAILEFWDAPKSKEQPTSGRPQRPFDEVVAEVTNPDRR